MLTVAEVVALLRLSRSMVHKLHRRGVLPAVRFGRCLRFRREDVEALMRGEEP